MGFHTRRLESDSQPLSVAALNAAVDAANRVMTNACHLDADLANHLAPYFTEAFTGIGEQDFKENLHGGEMKIGGSLPATLSELKDRLTTFVDREITSTSVSGYEDEESKVTIAARKIARASITAAEQMMQVSTTR